MTKNCLAPLGISEADYKSDERAKLVLECEKLHLEKEKLAHSRWWQEDALVNNRVTWLLQSQVILFAAYGLLAKSGPEKAISPDRLENLLAALPWLGFSIGLAITLGIHAAWTAQKVLYGLYKEQGITVGVHSVTTTAGRMPGRALPLIFAAGWGWLYRGCWGAVGFVVVSLAMVVVVDWQTRRSSRPAAKPAGC